MFKIILLLLFVLQPWYFGGVIRAEFLVIFVALTVALIKKETVFPWKTVCAVFFLVFLTLAITVLSMEFDISLFKKYVSLLILVTGSVLLVRVFDISKNDVLKACKGIVLISLMYYFLAVLFPFFRDFSLSLKGETYGIEQKLEVYRLWFPTSAHTFHLGLLFFSTTVLFLLEKQRSFWIVISLICASIAARSAMLASILVIFSYIIYKDRKYIYAVIFAIPFFIASIYYLSEQSMAAKYALEPIIQLVETGKFESKSSSDLIENHLYVPTEKQILLGDGRYVDAATGAFYGHSDSGIVRPLLYGGILFQLVYLSLCLYFFRYFISYGLFGWFIIMLFFAMNVKAELITSTPYLALLLILSEVDRNNDSKNQKVVIKTVARY